MLLSSCRHARCARSQPPFCPPCLCADDGVCQSTVSGSDPWRYFSASYAQLTITETAVTGILSSAALSVVSYDTSSGLLLLRDSSLSALRCALLVQYEVLLPGATNGLQNETVRGCVPEGGWVSYALQASTLPNCIWYEYSLNPGSGDVDMAVGNYLPQRLRWESPSWSYSYWAYDYSTGASSTKYLTSTYQGAGMVETIRIDAATVTTMGRQWYITAAGMNSCTGESGCPASHCAFDLTIQGGPAYILVNGSPSTTPTPTPTASRTPSSQPSRQPAAGASSTASPSPTPSPSSAPVVVLTPEDLLPPTEDVMVPLNSRTDFLGQWQGVVAGAYAYSMARQRYECLPATIKANIPHELTITSTQWVDHAAEEVMFLFAGSRYRWNQWAGVTYGWEALDNTKGLYTMLGSHEASCHYVRVFEEGDDRELLWVSLVGPQYTEDASCDVDRFRLPPALYGAGRVQPFCNPVSEEDGTAYGQSIVRRYRLSGVAKFRASQLETRPPDVLPGAGSMPGPSASASPATGGRIPPIHGDIAAAQSASPALGPQRGLGLFLLLLLCLSLAIW